MSAPQKPSADIENIIRSLNGVISACIVTGKSGEIEEIHVLADSTKAPKQIVRDVESALMAKFEVEIDHKKVSVAQTQNGKQPHVGGSRLKFSDVAISLNGVKAEATVHLKNHSEMYTGTATGHSSSHNQLRLIATATLRAAENSQNADGALVLEDLSTLTLSGRNVVVVSVTMVTPRDEDLLSGSAIVKQDLWKAVVNASLDAVNRRLGAGIKDPA